MPQVINNQRKVELDGKVFEGFLEHAFATITEISDRTATVAFISDRRMKQLNQFFRGKYSTTDVLSFPHQADDFEHEEANNLGDIIISAEQAERQAKENGLTLEDEIRQLILHGLLHLVGYDHETDDGEMNAIELKLRKQLGI